MYQHRLTLAKYDVPEKTIFLVYHSNQKIKIIMYTILVKL